MGSGPRGAWLQEQWLVSLVGILFLSQNTNSSQLWEKSTIYTRHWEKPQCCPTLVSLFISHSLPSAVKQSQNKPAEIHFSGRGGCGGALKDQLECAFAEDVPMRARQDKQTECRGQVAIKKVRKVHWWPWTVCLVQNTWNTLGMGAKLSLRCFSKAFLPAGASLQEQLDSKRINNSPGYLQACSALSGYSMICCGRHGCRGRRSSLCKCKASNTRGASVHRGALVTDDCLCCIKNYQREVGVWGLAGGFNYMCEKGNMVKSQTQKTLWTHFEVYTVLHNLQSSITCQTAQIIFFLSAMSHTYILLVTIRSHLNLVLCLHMLQQMKNAWKGTSEAE